MKINKAELEKALEKVKPGLASKELIEQATSFAFVGDRVVTYNDEISISHPVKGLEDVRGAVKAQALYEFLKKVKRDEIDLEWGNSQVIINAGRTKAGLIFEQEMKLPIDDEIGEITKWSKLPDKFIEAIKLCYPCCSRDMSRPILTCVNINGKFVEASDSYQIIRYELDREIAGKGLLIPATSTKELVRYDIKEVSQGATSWVHFKTEDGTMFSVRVVGGEFPNIDQFLKADKAVEFSFPDLMPEALQRADIFAKKGTSEAMPVVDVEVNNGHMKLSAKNEFGWFEEKMRTKHQEANFKFSIGIEFLISLFERLKTCLIGSDRIWFSGENWNHVVATMAPSEKVD